MKAASQLQPVPTAIDRFHEAVSVRDSLFGQSAELQVRIASLQPLEAAHAEAQAELAAVTNTEAQELEAWATAGAVGPVPAPDAKARERVAAKLAAAQQSLRAAGVARSSIEREMLEINQRLQPAQAAVQDARAHVLGEELLRTHAEFLRVHDEHERLERRFALVADALHAASVYIAAPYTAQVQQTLVARLNTPSTIPHEAAAAHAEWIAETFGNN